MNLLPILLRETSALKFLKKSLGHLLKTPEMKYRFIEQFCSVFRVKKMYRILDISRSGYYEWKKRPMSVRQKENEGLVVAPVLPQSSNHKEYSAVRTELPGS